MRYIALHKLNWPLAQSKQFESHGFFFDMVFDDGVKWNILKFVFVNTLTPPPPKKKFLIFYELNYLENGTT